MATKEANKNGRGRFGRMWERFEHGRGSGGRSRRGGESRRAEEPGAAGVWVEDATPCREVALEGELPKDDVIEGRGLNKRSLPFSSLGSQSH